MAAVQLYANIVRDVKEAYRVISNLDLFEQYDHQQIQIARWCNIIQNNINFLNNILTRGGVPVAERRSLQSNIVLLHSFHVKFTQLNVDAVVIGGAINNPINQLQWQELENAFNNNIQTGCVINITHKDLNTFLNDAKPVILQRIQHIVREQGNIKAYVILSCKFENVHAENVIEEMKTLQTSSEAILQDTPLDDWYGDAVACLLRKVEEFEHRDSGWRLVEVDNLLINVCRYVPFQVGLSTYIALPTDIQHKKAVLNIENFDEYCFLWCVTAALHPQYSHPERTTVYPHFSQVLHYEGISFPIALKDISKFEAMNELSINVYGIETVFDDQKKVLKSVVVPVHLSSISNPQRPTIHLLMIETDAGEDVGEDVADNLANYNQVFHFALIKNLSRLVKSQLSKSKCKLFFCDRCLCHFKVEKSFINHKLDCSTMNSVRMILPEEDENILSFKNFKFQDPVPFVVYADLECILEPEVDNQQKHVPHSVAFYQKCHYNNALSEFKLNRSPQCIEWFIHELQNLASQVHYFLKHPVAIKPLTAAEEEIHKTSNCHICGKPIVGEARILEHCHFTGKYRGPSHNACNLAFRKSHIIPIIFHNLSGYDSHFLIEALAAQSFKGEITIIPTNKEKYIAISKHVHGTNVHLRFIDSFRFMASSIDS